ncbi:MAG: SGNH/GDSL hydrolase family protein [Candidatus Methylomirabilia bacterium]
MAVAVHLKRRSVVAVGLGTVVLAPYVVGAVHGSLWFSALYFLFGLVIVSYALAARRYSRGTARLGLLIVSCSFALTAVDLISRPLLTDALYYRPHEMFFINPWPDMPSLARYAKNVSYEGQASGDLAAISGMTEYRQTRNVIFRTDGFGFRNDPKARDRIIDVVILGDSFGAGNGTSQDKTWGTILSKRHGLRVYNLSLPGGPWQELMNLKIEFDRIETQERSILLWVIFGGNDLDDDIFHDGLETPDRNPALRRALVSLSGFRERSPVRQMLRRSIVARNAAAARGAVVTGNFVNGKRILFLRSYADRRDRTVEEIVQLPNYGKLTRVFGEMAEFARSKGVAVAVVLVPTKAEVYSWVLDGKGPWSADRRPSGVSTAVREMSQANGFRFLDLKAFLIEESKRVFQERGDLLWWYDDTHWNETGHEVVSRIIHEHLLLGMQRM